MVLRAQSSQREQAKFLCSLDQNKVCESSSTDGGSEFKILE